MVAILRRVFECFSKGVLEIPTHLSQVGHFFHTLLQRDAIVGHAEAIRTQSRKPSKALLPYHIGSRVAYVHTCYKETGWQGTHRQSETRAGNHRMHTRIRNAGPPALREPQTATPQPHSYASRFATQGSNHTLNL